jgi:predicted Zn-ribbon and HTH transcriptional regulator
MIDLLSQKEMSARELSQEVGIREKEVYEHLPHMARSVIPYKKKLYIIPSQCLGCSYVFANRTRFSPPSRCPRCKSEHIENPRYRIS